MYTYKYPGMPCLMTAHYSTVLTIYSDSMEGPTADGHHVGHILHHLHNISILLTSIPDLTMTVVTGNNM